MLGSRCSVDRENEEFQKWWRMVAVALTKVFAPDTTNNKLFYAFLRFGVEIWCEKTDNVFAWIQIHPA